MTAGKLGRRLLVIEEKDDLDGGSAAWRLSRDGVTLAQGTVRTMLGAAERAEHALVTQDARARGQIR